MNLRPLTDSLRYGLHSIAGRWIYFALMVAVPLMATFFFLNLMESGLPTPVPVAVVDKDHSTLSRQLIRTLGSGQMTEIVAEEESYHSAIELVRSGKVMGFFLIPQDFKKDTESGQQPTLTYYCNLTYYVPGSLAFKGFKTVAISTTGGIVSAKLVGTGVFDGSSAGTLIQPLVINQFGIGNPWLNYNYYLSVSFLAGLIALLVMQTAAASITNEIKDSTSPEWLARSGGSMSIALMGKLLPQTVVWSAVGICIEAILFKFCHFPLNNHAMHLIVAMVLMIIACQAFAVTICCALPNVRLSLTVCSLVGILSFSIAAFSFPVTSMYGAIGIFSYILPVRYFFQIYADQGLNGIPIYYSRFYYAALLVFPLVAMLGLGRLRKRCLKPVYVP